MASITDHAPPAVDRSDGVMSIRVGVDTYSQLNDLLARMRHPDILSRICQNVAKAQLATLMRTSKQLYELAGPILYRSLAVANIHKPLPCTPLFGLSTKREPGFRELYFRQESEEYSSDRKHNLLCFTRVLRLSRNVCARHVPRSEGIICFPNIRTLHKTVIEPCESRDPDTIACHIFEFGKSLHLQILVLRNDHLLDTWRQYCRPGWPGPPWDTVKRIVHVWDSPRSIAYGYDIKNERQKRVRNGEGLDAFNIVLRPDKDLGTWAPVWPFYRRQGTEDPSTYADMLAMTLAEVCACDVKRVIVAGAERLGETVWRKDDRRGRILSAEKGAEALLRKTRKATRAELARKGITDRETVSEKLDRIVFMTLGEYFDGENGPDELDREDLIPAAAGASYQRPLTTPGIDPGLASDEESGYDATAESD